MSIQNLTIKEAQEKLKEYEELKKVFNIAEDKNCGNNLSDHPFQEGKPYFIRTVTMTIVGKLEKVFNSELVLSTASWIANSGRFSDAIQKGTLDEVEPFNFDENVVIGRHSIIDATVWCHDLPKEQK